MDRGINPDKILHEKEIPKGAKNLMIPLLKELQALEHRLVGSIELAYRRGKQEGEEKVK